MNEYLKVGYSLVVGSELSGYDFRVENIIEFLKTKYSLDDEFYGLFDVSNYLLDKGVSRSELISSVRLYFEKSTVDSVLEKVASRPWRSVLSLSFDSNLLEEISKEINKRVTSRTVSAISERGVNPAPGSYPYYMLMGDISDERLSGSICINKIEYLKRRRIWRDLLKSFPDYNKSSALVFMGTNRDSEIVLDLINELLSISPGLPSKLIFFKGDPCAVDESILSLLPGHVEVQVLSSTLRNWLSGVEVESKQLNLPLGSMEGVDYDKLREVSEKVHPVPRVEDIDNIDEMSHNRLIDYLFRPSELNWGPYRLNLDFERDIMVDIKSEIDNVFRVGGGGIVYLTGEAGVGKTVSLRRLAFNYANSGYLSLWIKRSLGYKASLNWSKTVRVISESVRGMVPPRVVLFFDGAFGRFDNIDELIQALSSESIPWCLVLCRRKTDEIFFDEDGGSQETFRVSESSIEFPNVLTDGEIVRLPNYLVSIKAFADLNGASELVSKVCKNNASDVLCALWYLMPETRSSISSSLSDEYFSLGGIEGAVQKFAKETATKKDWARRAYELVTTCSGLDIPIPIEILVRALNIEYQDWLDSCKNGEPIWGLLYDESYNNGESYAYRTRNEVVTNVLLRALNGSQASHVGELRCIKDILKACEVGTSIYREMATSILIGKKRELKKKFNFEQGLELFDIALSSLPYQDRSLVHHKGLWIKDMSDDSGKAYAAISEALKTDDYPFSDRGESLGNVHTSLASCIVKDIESINHHDHEVYSNKLMAIEDHISQAERVNPFDPYSSHVSANMFIKVASRFKGKDDDLYLSSMANAVRIISSSLSIVSSSLRGKSRSYLDSITMLNGLEERLFQISDDFEDNDIMALAEFNRNKSQTGFYVIAKVLISEAFKKNKGKLFKKAGDYIQCVEDRVDSSGEELDVRLIECRADLEIKWHLIAESSRSPDWDRLLDDLKTVVSSGLFARSILMEFYLAVCLYHLGKVNDAEAIFVQFRRREIPSDLRRIRRCYMVDGNGNPKMLQGIIKDGYQKKFVYCAQMTNEFMCGSDFKERKETLVHFYLAFTFQGPIAVKNPPVPNL